MSEQPEDALEPGDPFDVEDDGGVIPEDFIDTAETADGEPEDVNL